MSAQVAYDDTYDPPAPVVRLRVAGPDGDAAVLVTGLVDTGADCTLIPATVASGLRLPPIDRVEIAGGAGGRASALVYAGRVEIASIGILVRLVAYEDEVVVGRDILNHLVAHLDGPRLHLRLFARRDEP